MGSCRSQKWLLILIFLHQKGRPSARAAAESDGCRGGGRQGGAGQGDHDDNDAHDDNDDDNDDQVIAAEGEKKASQALREAADTISQSPAALQLRYLQVVTASDWSILIMLP